MPIFFKDQSALEKEFSFLTKIDRKLSNSFGVYARLRHVQVQHEIGFDSRFVIRESTNEIRGYFQSYIYAEKYKSDFAMKLSKVGHTSKLLEIRNLADARKPIALHVRCGDYLKLGRIYGSLSHVYYDEALGYLQQYGNLSDIWIFSDDLFHARKILSGSKYLSDMNFEIANQFDGTQTMYLMSHCDRHIIANSTFSWWGAFLASKSRAVVAPEPWFRNGATPNQLIPREWKSIQRST
jgi:hypothetical protein